MTMSYRNAFILALGLHMLLGLSLMLSPSTTTFTVKASPQTQAPKPIVNAVTVNEQDVLQEVQRLRSEQQRSARLERERQAQLKRQAIETAISGD